MSKSTENKKKFSFFRRFLLFLSATDTDYIQQCPKRDVLLQEIKGIAVLLTSIFAFFSGTYAAFLISGNYVISSIIGLLWGLTIMNIDRLLVSAIGAPASAPLHKKIGANFIYPVFIRLPLALLLGVVISVPIELQIFSPEINVYLSSNENNRVSRLDSLMDLEKDSINLSFNREKLGAYNRRRDEFLVERERYQSQINNAKAVPVEIPITNTDGSYMINDSGNVIYRKKYVKSNMTSYAESQLKEIERQLKLLENKYVGSDSLRIKELQILLKRVEKKYEGLKKSEETPINSLASRYYALSQVRNSNVPMNKLAFGLRMLIILIEIMPVIIKILSRRTQYERLLDNYDNKESERLEGGNVR